MCCKIIPIASIFCDTGAHIFLLSLKKKIARILEIFLPIFVHEMLFRKKGYMLDEIFSKFAIFLEYEKLLLVSFYFILLTFIYKHFRRMILFQKIFLLLFCRINFHLFVILCALLTYFYWLCLCLSWLG